MSGRFEIVEKVLKVHSSQLANLNQKIEDVRQELKTEIQGVRQELKAEIHDVRNEVQQTRSDLSEKIDHFGHRMSIMETEVEDLKSA